MSSCVAAGDEITKKGSLVIFTEFTEFTDASSDTLLAWVGTGFRHITPTISNTQHYIFTVPGSRSCAIYFLKVLIELQLILLIGVSHPILRLWDLWADMTYRLDVWMSSVLLSKFGTLNSRVDICTKWFIKYHKYVHKTLRVRSYSKCRHIFSFNLITCKILNGAALMSVSVCNCLVVF